MVYTLASLFLLLYWGLYTIRRALTPKLGKKLKAHKWDLKSGNEETKHTAERLHFPLLLAKWALRVVGWAENVLIVLIIAWFIYFVGAFITQTVVFLDFPI